MPTAPVELIVAPLVVVIFKLGKFKGGRFSPLMSGKPAKFRLLVPIVDPVATVLFKVVCKPGGKVGKFRSPKPGKVEVVARLLVGNVVVWGRAVVVG